MVKHAVPFNSISTYLYCVHIAGASIATVNNDPSRKKKTKNTNPNNGHEPFYQAPRYLPSTLPTTEKTDRTKLFARIIDGTICSADQNVY